ncbi:MAG: hypothetical protein IAG13_29715 [Deltaproteobacteria bacterium]|nr:hypothetical protein [Nannocystaceae bacterium]
MAPASDKLEALLQRLERTGAEPARLDSIRCAQQFKRSWIELAGKLVELRKSRSYEAWGFDDFHRYCAEELQLRRATVDKLTISFSTLERVAPQVLTWDGVAKTIPSYEAVDYLGRAMGLPPVGDDGEAKPRRRDEPAQPRELIKEVRSAVFDEGQTVAELRKRFDPVLWPKPKGAEKLELLIKAGSLARKLAEVLTEIDGLSEKRAASIEQALGGLRQELDALAEPLREKLARGQDRGQDRGQARGKKRASAERN